MSKKRIDFRPRLFGQVKEMYQNWTKEESRVLIIGDTHCPFDFDSYLDFFS